MRYQQPWGVSDPDAPYINGSPATGQEGSIPPAAAFEQHQRELVNLITRTDQAPSDTDLLQVTKGVRSQFLNYAVDTGTANQLTVAFDPPFAPVTNPYTPGLTLHVRVRATNVAGQVSIDAGAGRLPVRRMNNQDLSPGDLPINCIATLIFDGGTAFQLSNFGVSSGDTNITQVNVPYCVDQSTTLGRIEATPLTTPLPLIAGNIIAVQVMNTTPGATTLRINQDDNEIYDVMPNGGGIMLQGDIVAGDVVQFFHDGVALRFTPNPEINAAVEYTVGPAGQQFPDIQTAMNALKRKIIGANGYVTLRLAGGTTSPLVFLGQIDVAHPSGDRLTIRGTMIGPNPLKTDFQAFGSSQQQRLIDGAENLNRMRTRYGTEIRVTDRGNFGAAGVDYGIRNTGAGRVSFQDLLIVIAGDSPPPMGPNGEWWTIGVICPPGLGVLCRNVTVSGCHCGFQVSGAMVCGYTFASNCRHMGYSISGSLGVNQGGAFGNEVYGYVASFGSIAITDDRTQGNGVYGVTVGSGAGCEARWGSSLLNGTDDFYATGGSSIAIIGEPPPLPPYAFNTASPPANGTVGNSGAVIVTLTAPRPPPATLP